jgi:hypothetical protein
MDDGQRLNDMGGIDIMIVLVHVLSYIIIKADN